MFSILTKRKDGKLLDAVVYECSAQHANELSPDRRSLTAYTATKFSRAFPGAVVPEPSKKPEDADLKKWIKKIEAAPKPKYGGWKGKGESCTAELKTKKPDDKRIYWQVSSRKDVRDLIVRAAKKQGKTITALIETIMIEWLNQNNLGGGELPARSKDSELEAYYIGRIARHEKDAYGEVSLDEYLVNTGRKLTAVRKKFIADCNFGKETGELFRYVRKDNGLVRLNESRYPFFFAGFCGIDPQRFNDSN